MAQIVLRAVKGQPLTIAEADANFNNLNTEVGLKLNYADYTAADVLTKLLTVDGSGSGLDADLVDGMNAVTTNTANTVVARDQSGNFAANIITANLVGNVTGNVTGNFTGTVTGVASNVSGVVAIINGGTGATSASAARTSLGLGTISTQAANNVNITGGSITGITKLAIADGGTGSGTATAARINLGLNIGSDVQAYSSELNAIAGLQSGQTGLLIRTAANTYVTRYVVTGTNGISVTNGSGISGDPTISIASNAAVTLGSLSIGNITSTGTVSASTLSATSAGITTVSATTLNASGNASITGSMTSGSVSTGSIGCGNITSSGSITAVGNITGYYSDDRLKDKLGKIESALDKLCSLEGFYFQANATAQELGYTTEQQVGVSAQSVQAVLPEVVGPAPIDPQYLTVDYARMMPLVIEAIKELRAEINALK
jgi:hypothetical protein